MTRLLIYYELKSASFFAGIADYNQKMISCMVLLKTELEFLHSKFSASIEISFILSFYS